MRLFIIYLFVFLPFILFPKGVCKMDSVVKLKEIKRPIRITSVFFPTDGGRWTDPIDSAFSADLMKTNLTMKLKKIGYQFGKTKDSELVDDIAETKPDYVFLPDDFLYKNFAKEINMKTGAYILFVAFHSDKKSLNLVDRQSGIVSEAPIKFLLETTSRLNNGKKIDTVALIGGPFARSMASHIESQMPLGIGFTSHITSSWEDYVETATKLSSKEGIVLFSLAPFGVKTSSGNEVEDFMYQNLMFNLNHITVGYGGIKSYSRTISMSIKPDVMGQNAAALLYEIISRDAGPSLVDYTSSALKINNDSVLKLGLQVPKDLLGFVTL